jgi:hypothetical protein
MTPSRLPRPGSFKLRQWRVARAKSPRPRSPPRTPPRTTSSPRAESQSRIARRGVIDQCRAPGAFLTLDPLLGALPDPVPTTGPNTGELAQPLAASGGCACDGAAMRGVGVTAFPPLLGLIIDRYYGSRPHSCAFYFDARRASPCLPDRRTLLASRTLIGSR